MKVAELLIAGMECWDFDTSAAELGATSEIGQFAAGSSCSCSCCGCS